MLRPAGSRPAPIAGCDYDGLAAAHHALDLALRDPAAALRVAAEVIAARTGPHAAAVAHRAAGLALADIEDLPAAVDRFRQAIAIADRHELRAAAAKARMSLAVSLAGLGKLPAALRELDRAAQASKGVDRAEVLAQRALLLGRAGRFTESMDGYRTAIPVLRRSGNIRFEALALLNRGALRALHGDLPAAETDLRRCASVARDGDLTQVLADAENNLGYVAACRGDVSSALAAFARAERVPGVGPGQLAATWTDRATALLRVGLAGEAAQDAARAVALLERTGRVLDAASARLLLAEALLADGDPASACELARSTAVDLRRQHRRPWATQAMHVAVAARYAVGERSGALIRAARANAVEAERLLGSASARHPRLLLARMLVDRGRTVEAAALIADRPGRNASAHLQLADWTVRALMHRQNQKDAAARRAVRAGLRVVTDYAAALGASELRAGAAAHGRELAQLGIRLALDTEDPVEVLAAAETLRARSLDRPATRPPKDAILAADLAALRQITTEIATGGGMPRTGLRAERARLERSIRDRTRTAPRGADGPPPPLSVRAIATKLGTRALVAYLRSDEDLCAVTIVDAQPRLHRLGPWSRLAREIAAARFAAHRIWRAGYGEDVHPAVHRALAHAADALDAALLCRLPEIADRALVLAPTAELHAISWSLLPSTLGRPVQVVPSLGWWQTKTGQARPGQSLASTGQVLLAAGPGLRHAGPEVRAIGRRRPDALVLTGRQSTVEAILAGLDGADLAHLACHGHYRADHPDFSALELSDGPLTVHDLHRLRRPPRILVLSACEAARSAARPGEEIMGLAAALLALGTHTLIAPVTAVPDRGTRVLMSALHERLAVGDSPPVGLARATADTGLPGFTCFGGD